MGRMKILISTLMLMMILVQAEGKEISRVQGEEIIGKVLISKMVPFRVLNLRMMRCHLGEIDLEGTKRTASEVVVIMFLDKMPRDDPRARWVIEIGPGMMTLIRRLHLVGHMIIVEDFKETIVTVIALDGE